MPPSVLIRYTSGMATQTVSTSIAKIKEGDQIKVTHGSSINHAAGRLLVPEPGTSEVFRVFSITSDVRNPPRENHSRRRYRVYTVVFVDADTPLGSIEQHLTTVECSPSQKMRVLAESAGGASGPDTIAEADGFTLQADPFQPDLWSV